jgi:pimeloyl-ACP methyl ester carboxylesterase
MPKIQTIRWDKVDQPISGLSTDVAHEIRVQHEAIPLVFVPGIMGTRLRRTDLNRQDAADGLPILRWDPGSSWFMLNDFSGTSGAHRKRMLVGSAFNPNFLEVDNANPVGDGFHGIMDDYWTKFLNQLKKHDWGPLDKIFVFPVYAFGYNWTDSNENSGKKLAARIQEIIKEAKKVTGLCEKVILITHSMGGLVARWASEVAGARDSILGVIHGVQPVTGATAAYWRIKAGFEGLGMTSRVLGHSAHEVVPVLGNLPGGLQLLPNKLYRANDRSQAWLTVTEKGKTTFALPRKSNPYNEIYRVKAVVQPKQGEQPSTNTYWGLVDPDLLDPGNANQPAKPTNDAMCAQAKRDSWLQYLLMLNKAESFHNTLGTQAHPQTFCFHGTDNDTADVIELRVESNWFQNDPYPIRGFRGFFTNRDGKSMQAVLQDPDRQSHGIPPTGDGDGTVAVSSATTLDNASKPFPGDRAFNVEHQPAYNKNFIQAYTVKAIIALCKMRYEALRYPLGDFPKQQGPTRFG